MMKKIVLTLALLVCSLVASSQKPLSLDPESIDNVYLFALTQHCRSIDSVETKTIYVRKNNFVGESWPTKIRGFNIVYLRTRKQYRDAIRQNGGTLTIMYIDLFEWEGHKYNINVSPLMATYRWWNVRYAKGGDSSIVHCRPENQAYHYVLFSHREMRDVEPPFRAEPWR